jgi:hypothetical protein
LQHIGPHKIQWIKPGKLEARVEFAEYGDSGIPRFPSVQKWIVDGAPE